MQKFSKQRELIKDAVLGTKAHPTASDVYLSLKDSCPNISLATVYRNLNILSDSGIINKISVPNEGDRFDGQIGEHYHIICDTCGRIYDVDLPHAFDIDKRISDQTGFWVKSHQLIVRGICKNCIQNNIERGQ